MGFESFLSKVAPWVAAAATGNIPGMVSLAAQTVSKVIGKPVAASTDAISAAVAGATPEQLLALKQADNEVRETMAKLDFENAESLAKIAADDRANAREREKTLKDRIPAILSIFTTVGFFGLLTAMLFVAIPSASEKIVDIMVGALGAAWTQSVMGYYFGSSATHDAITIDPPEKQ